MGEIERANFVGLRDQFAMAALAGIAANQYYANRPYESCAKEAYKYADAMMEERDENHK